MHIHRKIQSLCQVFRRRAENDIVSPEFQPKNGIEQIRPLAEASGRIYAGSCIAPFIQRWEISVRDTGGADRLLCNPNVQAPCVANRYADAANTKA